MMRETTCDVAIIGAGTAGLAAREAAVKVGAKTILIEAGPGGTTCARTGCMPSKLLIAAARKAHEIEQATKFGVETQSGARVNGNQVLERVRRERDHFVSAVLADVASVPPSERLRGYARFASANTLMVDDNHRVTAKAFVIATGASSTIPEPLKSLSDRVLTNESVFELRSLPGSLGVIGSGPLGIELAQAFARLGVRTIVFDKTPSIGGLKDPEIIQAACHLLLRELDLKLDSSFLAQADQDLGVKLSWIRDTSYGTYSVEKVLSAAGRPPNIGGLDLEKTGLELDEHGVPKFDPVTMQCGTSPIFIAGDADATRPVLHSASHEGKIAGANAALFPHIKSESRNVPLAMVFTDPGLASVGRSFAKLDPNETVIGKADFADNGRARIDGQDAGLIHLYAGRDGTLLGGEMAGPGVEHIAHLLCWAIQMKVSAADLSKMPYYHPTAEEALQAAARDLVSSL